MKLTIKTGEIEIIVEQDLNVINIAYNDSTNNFMNVIKNIIEKCSIETQAIIKQRNENKDLI